MSAGTPDDFLRKNSFSVSLDEKLFIMP